VRWCANGGTPTPHFVRSHHTAGLSVQARGWGGLALTWPSHCLIPRHTSHCLGRHSRVDGWLACMSELAPSPGLGRAPMTTRSCLHVAGNEMTTQPAALVRQHDCTSTMLALQAYLLALVMGDTWSICAGQVAYQLCIGMRAHVPAEHQRWRVQRAAQNGEISTTHRHGIIITTRELRHESASWGIAGAYNLTS
jgi:hypothetical protein